MEAIKDFARKQEDLISIFERWDLNNGFILLKSKMDAKFHIKATEESRDVFERALNEVRYYGSIQGYASMREIENDLMEHADKYSTIKIRISKLLKYPDFSKVDFYKSKWLDALLDAGVINEEERFDFCLHLQNCAKTMRRNVEEMNLLLDKYGLNKKNGTKTGKKKNSTKKQPKFSDIIQYEDKDKLVKRLHALIDNKSGADVGAVIMNAKYIEHYLTRYPTQAEFESEFELIGGWSAIHNYFDENNQTAIDKANLIVIFR